MGEREEIAGYPGLIGRSVMLCCRSDAACDGIGRWVCPACGAVTDRLKSKGGLLSILWVQPERADVPTARLVAGRSPTPGVGWGVG